MNSGILMIIDPEYVLDFDLHLLSVLNNEINEETEIRLQLITISGYKVPVRMRIKSYEGRAAADGYMEALTFFIFTLEMENLMKPSYS